jgi:broad specificity phosphatase PhoE
MFILVRHGETEWSATGRHTGRTDIPLTPTGEMEAEALRPWLAQTTAGRRRIVFCSPKQRALRTAELAGLAPCEVDDDLVEWDYGAYEGLTTEQIRQQAPGWTVFSELCPGGETAAQIAARCDRVLARIYDQLGGDALIEADKGRDDGDAAGVAVVVVSHGHLLRSLAARWLGQEVAAGAALELGTAAMCLLGIEHGTHTLRRWNLPNPLRPLAPVRAE